MADMMDTLKGLLGEDAEDKISGIMQILNPNNSKSDETVQKPSKTTSENENIPTLTPEMLMVAQQLMSKLSSSGDDDRTKLLMSLKPYMSGTRKSTIDSAIKMLNLAEMSQFFKGVI